MYKPKSTCYTCLNKNALDLKQISASESDNIAYREKLKSVLNTELQQVDIHGICGSCVNVLRITYTFITMVKESQETLRVILASKKHEQLEEIVEILDSDDDSNCDNENKYDNSEKVQLKLRDENITKENDSCNLDNGTNEFYNEENAIVITQQNICLPEEIKLDVDSESCFELDKSFNNDSRTDEYSQRNSIFKEHSNVLKDENFYRSKKIKLEMEHETLLDLPPDDINKENIDENYELEADASVKLKQNIYICEFCRKCFNEDGLLYKHILTHISVKLYKCNHCSNAFCTASYLNRHLKLHMENHDTRESNVDHQHETVECDYCEEFATSLSDPTYKFSERAHLNCEQCVIGFKTNIQVMKHINLVHEENLYNCDFCNEGFKRLYQLQLHLHKNYECYLYDIKINQVNLKKIPTGTDEVSNEKPLVQEERRKIMHKHANLDGINKYN